jgi:hypothetical protein
LTTPQQPMASQPTDAAPLPAGAIRVAERLYMVPIGVDRAGCEQFRAHVPGGLGDQALHYRRADGGFTLDRDVTVCQVRMVPIAPDAAGCPRFRAQPQGDLSPSAVAYYRAKDGSYRLQPDQTACPS